MNLQDKILAILEAIKEKTGVYLEDLVPKLKEILEDE